MAWVLEVGRPIYAQLVERLQVQIVSGAYPPGGKLPSVRELAAVAEVNPNTMQKAFAELEKSGLIITQGTNGRVVTEDERLIQGSKRQLAKRHADAYFAGMEGLGYTRAQAADFLRAAEGKGEAEDE